MDDDILSVGPAEADQMSELASQRASKFMTVMANASIAKHHGEKEMEEQFLTALADMLFGLGPIDMSMIIWDLSARLIANMIEQVDGIENLRAALHSGLVLGMTTNKELAFRDLPSL